VLSDPEKRKKYDQFGSSAFENGGGGGQDFHFVFDDIFRKFEDNFGHNSFHFGGHQYGEQEHNFFSFEDFFQEVSKSASFILLFFLFFGSASCCVYYQGY
jgi:curved DNA-binding protein CbpA